MIFMGRCTEKGGFGNYLEDSSLHWHSFLCLRFVVHAVDCALKSCALLYSEIIKGVFPVSVKIEWSVNVPFSVSVLTLDSCCTSQDKFKGYWIHGRAFLAVMQSEVWVSSLSLWQWGLMALVLAVAGSPGGGGRQLFPSAHRFWGPIECSFQFWFLNTWVMFPTQGSSNTW